MQLCCTVHESMVALSGTLIKIIISRRSLVRIYHNYITLTWWLSSFKPSHGLESLGGLRISLCSASCLDHQLIAWCGELENGQSCLAAPQKEMQPVRAGQAHFPRGCRFQNRQSWKDALPKFWSALVIHLIIFIYAYSVYFDDGVYTMQLCCTVHESIVALCGTLIIIITIICRRSLSLIQLCKHHQLCIHGCCAYFM